MEIVENLQSGTQVAAVVDVPDTAVEFVLAEEGVPIVVEELKGGFVPVILLHGDGGVDGLSDGVVESSEIFFDSFGDRKSVV